MWVCSKCFELNSNEGDCCERCGEIKTEEVNSKRRSQNGGKMEMPSTPCNQKGTQVARVKPIRKHVDGVEPDEMRLVLIGKTGCGKSATGNTLFNENLFPSRSRLKSVTEKCHAKRKEHFGKKILVVDTPGLFDTSLPKEVIANEIRKCIAISAPGPHAFLLVMSLTNRFTEEEKMVLKEIEGMFGPHMAKYLIIIFTGRDQLEKIDTVENHIEDSPEELKYVLKEAGGGYITFNNRGDDTEKEADVKQLLERIDEMVKKNGGSHFTSDMFEEAEKIIQQRIAREIEVKERELRKVVEEELRAEMEEKIRQEKLLHEKLRDADLQRLEDMKLQLKRERESTQAVTPGHRRGKEELRNLIKDEMIENEKRNKMIMQLQKVHGPERISMQLQLADVGKEIEHIVKNRRKFEEDVTEEIVADEITKQSVIMRDEERENIENEEKNAMDRIKTGIKSLGKSFLNLFK